MVTRLLQQYWPWLIIVSLAVMIAERVAPWRKDQPQIRPLLVQDLFWLIFNGVYLGAIFGPAFTWINSQLASGFTWLAGVDPGAVQLLSSWPMWSQVLLILVVRDFIEWNVHLMLHAVPLFWRFHRLHHSIINMDWIGNFRFHWGEIFIYQSIKALPLLLLGVQGPPLLIAGVFATLIGHLNHSNLDLSYGPLRFVFNSPRMHIWHHERQVRHRFGVNYAIVFSTWDWLFRTVYFPLQETPEIIGFEGDEHFPQALWWRFLFPFWSR